MHRETYTDLGSYDKIQEEINEWTKPPVSKAAVDPMELIKMKAGYAVEQHQWTNYHHLAEMTQNKDVQKLFAQLSFDEEEHQSMLGSLIDPDTTPLEDSLALEMTALNGFADAAQLDQNENAKMVYDYILLDHMTQTNVLSDTASKVGTNPEGVFKGQIQVQQGRPWEKQYVPTSDIFKQPMDKNTDDITSFVHLHTLLAAEEQLRNSFHMMRTMLPSQDTRRIYNAITAVENIHISMLGSLHDPSITPLEYAMINELMEIRTHQMGMQMSKNDAAKQAHEYALNEDKDHLRMLQDAYSNIEKGDPTKFDIPDRLFAMPPMSANDYIRQMMGTQMNLMARGMGFERAA